MEKDSSKKTIGIGLVEHMGDIVACEPVSRYLRGEFPEAHIVWVVRKEYRELIDTNPNIDETLVVGCLTEWILLSKTGVFDEIFDLHINKRVCPTCMVPLEKTRGELDVAELTYFNYGSLLQAFSIGAGLPALDDPPKVYIPDAVVSRVDQLNLPADCVVVHTLTNESVKDWQEAKWIQLASEITHSFGLAVVEVGIKPTLANGGLKSYINLCGKLSILETAEVIRRSTIFIGVDSGPAHLANAVGTFGIILLGKYKVYETYNPFSGDYGSGINSHLVFSKDGVSEIKTLEVFKVFGQCLTHVLRGKRFKGIIRNYSSEIRKDMAAKEAGVGRQIRAIAFHLPQFHPIPENDRWWGKGFTDWTNASKVKPLYPGHYQPHIPSELGFYDLRLKEARNSQAELAKEHGIEGFCYWHYWFGGKQLLQRPVDEIISTGEPDFKFCLAWANESWSRRWDGESKEVLQEQVYGGEPDDTNHFNYLRHAFQDKRYMTVEGKPLFLIYRPAELPDPKRTLSLWRKLAQENGFKGLYILALKTKFSKLETDWTDFGFDGEVIHHPNFDPLFEIMNYQRAFLMERKYIPPGLPREKESYPLKFDYENAAPLLKLHNDRHLKNDHVYPTVMCSWDHSPRVGKRAVVLTSPSPEAYGKWLSLEAERLSSRDHEHRLLFINAWNEWAEGMYLEPDLRFGREFLESTKGALTGQLHEGNRKSKDQEIFGDVGADDKKNSIEVHIKKARASKTNKEFSNAEKEYIMALVQASIAIGQLIHLSASQKESKMFKTRLQNMKAVSAQLNGELAEIYSMKGRFEKANAVFLEGIDLEPTAVIASFETAEEMVRRGYFLSSLHLFLNLHDKAPRDVKVLLALGFILSKIGKADKAIEAYETVLLLQRDNAQAKQALVRLKTIKHKTFDDVTAELPKSSVPPSISKKSELPNQPFKEGHLADRLPSMPSTELEGTFFTHDSASLINRQLADLLMKQNIKVKLKPLEPVDIAIKANGLNRYRHLVKSTNPRGEKADVHIRNSWPPNLDPPDDGHWVIIQPWEFGSLPKDWVSVFSNEVDEIWVPSNYVRKVYVDSGVPSEKVIVVPNGIDPNIFRPDARPFRLQSKKQFKFLFVGGTILRKGIDILLDSYTSTFNSSDDVCLVIKDFCVDSFYEGMTFRDNVNELKRKPDSPEIEYLDRNLTEEEIAGLYVSCDVLVHPYRGEGFGLPILESMACGTPPMVTNGGAALDFCDNTNSILVDASIKRLPGKEIGGRTTVDYPWIYEIETRELSSKMQWAFEHREELKKLGETASKTIRTNWSWEKAAAVAAGRIMKLISKPVVRLKPATSTSSFKESYEHARNLAINGKISESMEIFEELLSVNPEHAGVLNDLGALYFQKGDKEKAVQSFERAVKSDPQNISALKNLADLYLDVGRVAEATKTYKDILAITPNDFEVIRRIAYVCSLLGKNEEAAFFYSMAEQKSQPVDHK
ncbi:MAG TPA: glycoside hydrolase family 99-like domain-containing protein [Candidatus Acidoferrales bacterium]|nr:glycoside hydrolase family 99-like domain-containing protein [Candidatus Acidoferrales bacterium]